MLSDQQNYLSAALLLPHFFNEYMEGSTLPLTPESISTQSIRRLTFIHQAGKSI